MDGATGGSGSGHSLGGSAPPATPDEIRRRRLAALGGGAMASTITPSHAVPSRDDNVDVSINNDEEDAELQAALAMSLQTDQDHAVPMETAVTEARTQDRAAVQVVNKDWYRNSTEFVVESFHQIMWDSLITTDNDKSRWVGQGIHTREESVSQEQPHRQEFDSILSLVGSNHAPWGLTQAHGGPCGVLAAVQAELLRLLLFGRYQNDLVYPLEPGDETEKQPDTSMEPISQELVKKGLAMAIAIILARAAITPPADSDVKEFKTVQDRVLVVLPTGASNEGLTWDDLEPWSGMAATTTTTTCKLRVYTVSCSDESNNNSQAKRQKKDKPESLEEHMVPLALAVTQFLLNSPSDGAPPPLDSFCHAGGVLLLVMSLVASRTSRVIQSDMDDPTGTRLTSQFGHCSQELINLLLTGQAVSNVFDNTLTPSGALTCRGIQSRPAVGYLSQLESLRYCEVGGYYKSPRFPIWVVGSTSHFTVLFGSNDCLKESKSDLLLETCRRAFKAVEGGEENGFIKTSSLGKVLQSLDLKYSDNAVQTLSATLEVSGAGIILWNDFWMAISRLMTGATIESVLQGERSKEDEPPPLLITQHGEAAVTTANKPQSQLDSDMELARKLAAEWNSSGDAATISSSDAVAARPASPMEMDAPSAAGQSDEDYARQLQAEFDGKGTVSVSNLATVRKAEAKVALATAGTANTAQQENLDFEQFGNSFKLYHYNGLRGGTITPFCVTRLTAENSVGHSIALSHHGSGNTGAQQGGGGGDLEDVVRTKWPSCTINWLGKAPPYID